MRTLKFVADCIVHGENAIDYLATIPGKRAFIVTSGDIARKLGQLNRIEALLHKAGIECACFDEVDPDPEIGSVLKGAAAMRAFEPDWIVAVGGGSAMDSAKAMWLAYEYPQYDSLEKFMPPNAILPTRQKAKLICIPTTSGTGSEVTRSVVLSDKARNLKLPFRDNTLIPDIAILEASFTTSMPPSLTAYTGMDALTHAVEAYVTRAASDFSDAFAEKAVTGIFEYLPLAYREPDNLLYREKMHNYATIAGMAFANVGLGIVHSIAHAFGGVFHVPHGLANAVVLPYVIDFNRAAPQADRRYAQLEKRLGVPDLRVALEQLKSEVQVAECMQSVVPDAAMFTAALPDLVKKALADSCTMMNPMPVDAVQMEQIIRQTYFGK